MYSDVTISIHFQHVNYSHNASGFHYLDVFSTCKPKTHCYMLSKTLCQCSLGPLHVILSNLNEAKFHAHMTLTPVHTHTLSSKSLGMKFGFLIGMND